MRRSDFDLGCDLGCLLSSLRKCDVLPWLSLVVLTAVAKTSATAFKNKIQSLSLFQMRTADSRTPDQNPAADLFVSMNVFYARSEHLL